MSDFQNDTNRSEILQSPVNITGRRDADFNNNNNNTNVNNSLDLNNNDTFSSYASSKENSSNNSHALNQQPQLVESDNNFMANNNQNLIKFTDSDEKEKDIDENIEGESKESPVEREEVHVCNVIVTIVAAFPADFDKESSVDSINKPRVTEGPKPQNFYKFEYQLMPDDNETVYTADLVTYKVAAKLFPEKSEPKVLKTWEFENKIWVVWHQPHVLRLTKSRLLKLFDHEVVLKIWDNRDFCTARTKFDKPKPFKFPKNENPEEVVKKFVFDECDKYLRQLPKELHDSFDRLLPNQSRLTPNYFHQELSEKMTNTLIAMQTGGNSQTIGLKLKELAADSELTKNVKLLKLESHAKNSSKLSKRSSQVSDLKTSRMFKKEKTKKEIAAEQEFLKKNGVTRIKLRMKILFAGNPYIIERLEQPLASVDDCFVSVTLGTSLMSEKQLYDLNPIAIKVEKLTNMPDKPIGFDKLQDKCDKVYCSYSFYKQPSYKTNCITQEKNLYFNDTNVYLAGLLNKQELHEFFHQTAFEIEIHDRDRKKVVDQPLKPCLFGNDAVDTQISNVNSVASKHTIHNPFETRTKHWDPYGVAKLNLFELVLGKKLIEFFVPVLPCAAPDVLGRTNHKESSNTKILGYDDQPLQSGAYLDSNTHINVRISVAKPLFETNLNSAQKVKNPIYQKNCIFGRIVIRADSNKYNIIKNVIENVRKMNAEALNLSEHSEAVQEAALSTYKLTEEEKESKTLNIITGFHLIDANAHIFVLEGLKENGIKYIYEEIPRSRDDSGIEVIYNSGMSFSQRLYTSLDVELIKIKLFEPLDEIVKKPLLYIRDMTPKTSFEALIKLQQLLAEFRLRNLTRCDLLPSADMIQSMSREFGVPLTDNELEQLKHGEKLSTDNFKNNYDSELTGEYGYNTEHTNIPHTSRIWTPIDNQNDQFLLHKKETQSKNYVAHNVESLKELHEKNKHKKPLKHYLLADEPNFKYSSQTLNSTDVALDRFRDFISKKTPKTLYSYNPEYYHSMTFVPVNLKQIEIDRKADNKNKWKSREGWIYPDVKTTMQCNEHPMRPDQATLDKLNEPWEENILHAYKMKSPLDRTFFKGPMRDKDFNVWSQPTPKETHQSLNLPVSIFEAGNTKENLERQIGLAEKEKWKEKVIVDNLTPKVHKLSASTELKESGFNSSNQLDKLKGLLKDEPKKKGLLAGGRNFDNIPSLAAVKTEYEDEKTRFVNSKGYIAGDNASMRITDDKNRIPVHFYDKQNFEKLKGHDFSFAGPSRPYLYKKLSSIDVNADQNPNETINFDKPKLYITPNQADMEYIENLNKKFKENRSKTLIT